MVGDGRACRRTGARDRNLPSVNSARALRLAWCCWDYRPPAHRRPPRFGRQKNAPGSADRQPSFVIVGIPSIGRARFANLRANNDANRGRGVSLSTRTNEQMCLARRGRARGATRRLNQFALGEPQEARLVRPDLVEVHVVDTSLLERPEFFEHRFWVRAARDHVRKRPRASPSGRVARNERGPAAPGSLPRGWPAWARSLCAVRTASSSDAAQHNVTWPYVGFRLPPAFRKASMTSSSGAVVMSPSPIRPASSAARGPPAATWIGGSGSGRS